MINSSEDGEALGGGGVVNQTSIDEKMSGKGKVGSVIFLVILAVLELFGDSSWMDGFKGKWRCWDVLLAVEGEILK